MYFLFYTSLWFYWVKDKCCLLWQGTGKGGEALTLGEFKDAICLAEDANNLKHGL